MINTCLSCTNNYADHCSTYHAITKATPCQLLFRIDMLFNIKYTSNWDEIKEQKQSSINKSKQAVNKKRLEHDYEIDNNV